jgi:type I restriction enzyme S subunit
MQEEKRLVPQLRFSEFEGEWEKKTLFDISKQVAYGMNAAAKSYDGENKYLRITDIDESTRRFIPNPLSSPKGKIEKKYILKKGDIVFTRTGASVGKSYLYDEKDGKLLYAGFLIKFNIINSNPYFVFLQTFRESYRKWVQVYSMRSGQPGLNAEEYKSLIINIPQSKEQQKIANFLTAIDNRIQTLEKKKSGLEQYKKGVMQKIFKQELRFKDDTSTTLSASDGKAFPEWEEKKLGDFLSLPKKETPEFIDIAKILTVKLNLKGVFLNNRTDGLKIGATKYIIRKKGQFIYGKQNLFNGAFAIIPDKFDGFVSSGDVPSLDIESNQLDSKFLYFFLARTSFYKKLENIASGSGSKRIHEKTLFKVEIGLPSLKEQTKIANFLSTVDKNIALVSKKIEHTKTYKKGLMQQMFV